MEDGLERRVAARAEAFAMTRYEGDLEDLPEDIQDELLEEAEEAVRGELETALDREIGSRIQREREFIEGFH